MKYPLFFCILLIGGVVESKVTFGQVQNDLSPDSATVYIMRPNTYGGLVNFTFFDGNQLIGKFNGGKYMIYKCTPGEHVFWARSENRSYLKANLAAGKLYMMEAVPQMGAFKAGVELLPLMPKHTNLKRFQKLVARRGPEVFSPIKLDLLSTEMVDVKNRGMDKLRKMESEGFTFKKLHENMDFSPSDLILVVKSAADRAKEREERKQIKMAEKEERKREKLARRAEKRAKKKQ